MAAAAKQAAFEAIGERRVAVLSQVFPAHSRLSVYIESDIPGYELQTVDVRVSNGSHTVQTYSESDNRALQADGMHRVLRIRAQPDHYAIRIEVRGRPPGPEHESGLVTGLVETGFAMPRGPHSLVVPVSAIQPANRTWYELIPYNWPVRRKEPQVRMARYLRHVGQTYGAMFELYEMLADGGPGVLDSHKVRTELAFGHIAFGMTDQARAHFDALLHSEPSLPAIVDLRIGLARLYLQEGQILHALALLEPPAPREPARRILWLELESRALIAAGRYQAAAALLEEAGHLAAHAQEPTFAHYPLILRFNRAVALMHAEPTGAGHAAMDELGRLPGDGAAERAIRDQANLALGFYLLDQGEGDAAGNVLQRVPADSVHAERALAGRGWAAVTTSATNRDAPLREVDGFRLQRSLTSWTTLVGGDASLPAVQESLVARAYAYHRLGLDDLAGHAFDGALNVLQAELERLAGAMTQLRDMRRTQEACAPLTLAGIDPGPPFIDEREFESVQRDHRQLCVLAAFLQAPAGHLLEAGCPGPAETPLRQRLSPDLRPWSECHGIADLKTLPDSGYGQRVAAERARTAARQSRNYMLDLLTGAIEARQARTEEYLHQALAGLAQYHER